MSGPLYSFFFTFRFPWTDWVFSGLQWIWWAPISKCDQSKGTVYIFVTNGRQWPFNLTTLPVNFSRPPSSPLLLASSNTNVPQEFHNSNWSEVCCSLVTHLFLVPEDHGSKLGGENNKDFNERLECTAPKHWSKYTTGGNPLFTTTMLPKTLKWAMTAWLSSNIGNNAKNPARDILFYKFQLILLFLYNNGTHFRPLFWWAGLNQDCTCVLIWRKDDC